MRVIGRLIGSNRVLYESFTTAHNHTIKMTLVHDGAGVMGWHSEEKHNLPVSCLASDCQTFGFYALAAGFPRCLYHASHMFSRSERRQLSDNRCPNLAL